MANTGLPATLIIGLTAAGLISIIAGIWLLIGLHWERRNTRSAAGGTQ